MDNINLFVLYPIILFILCLSHFSIHCVSLSVMYMAKLEYFKDVNATGVFFNVIECHEVFLHS